MQSDITRQLLLQSNPDLLIVVSILLYVVSIPRVSSVWRTAMLQLQYSACLMALKCASSMRVQGYRAESSQRVCTTSVVYLPLFKGKQ